MFLPAPFALALGLLWVACGALLGAAIGSVSARLLRLRRPRPRVDAAMGATAILAMYALMAAVASGAQIVDDQTLGWRGILFDHLVLWATGLVSLAVVGRQLVLARNGD